MAAGRLGVKWATGFMVLAAAVGGIAAPVDIEVSKPGGDKTHISVEGLRADDAAGRTFAATLQADLGRSGWFTVVAPGQRAAVVVLGSCSAPGGRLAASCEVRNTATGGTYLRKTFSGDGAQARRLAHEAADEIVRLVRGKIGIASTRIVMVGSLQGRKNLYMCDADGGNLSRLTRDNAVCLAPRWGPRAERVVYTSFHRGFPDVYMIDLAANNRRRVAGFAGLNAGADISPDGREVVLTLSKDGNPELYVMNLRNRKLTRLTTSRHAAEASPSWSPDGSRIVYVSDRSGKPHLYVMSRSGSGSQRITFRGSENVSPDWGPDGRIAYSSRREGRYQVCVIDPARKAEEWQITSDWSDYESPSWARDGRHIVCTRTARHKSDVYVLDTLGDRPIPLTSREGNWHSPAWSPK